MVALFGAGPGLYLDFAEFIFHVPINGSAANNVSAAASATNVKLRAIFTILVHSVLFTRSSCFLSARCETGYTALPRKAGSVQDRDSGKLLTTWSGRPDSNRRRPAWEATQHCDINDID